MDGTVCIDSACIRHYCSNSYIMYIINFLKILLSVHWKSQLWIIWIIELGMQVTKRPCYIFYIELSKQLEIFKNGYTRNSRYYENYEWVFGIFNKNTKPIRNCFVFIFVNKIVRTNFKSSNNLYLIQINQLINFFQNFIDTHRSFNLTNCNR